MALASTTACNQALNGLDASGTPTNLMAYTPLHPAPPGPTGAAGMPSIHRLAFHFWGRLSFRSPSPSSGTTGRLGNAPEDGGLEQFCPEFAMRRLTGRHLTFVAIEV